MYVCVFIRNDFLNEIGIEFRINRCFEFRKIEETASSNTRSLELETRNHSSQMKSSKTSQWWLNVDIHL